MVHPFWKTLWWFLVKLSLLLPYKGKHASWHFPKVENLHPYENLHTNVYISFTDIWQNMEEAKMSFRRWMDKTTVVHPKWNIQFSSVQFSHSVVSDSLRPYELQHARPPCPSPTPRVHSESHPSSQWCHPANSSSVIPFSSCPQSQPASESFPMSQLFAWGGQSTGFSALASMLILDYSKSCVLKFLVEK